MPQCHPVTYKSKEAKSQVSPSGASTDPAPLLGAIIGASYLNSVQLSSSVFILFLIRQVITIPRRHCHQRQHCYSMMLLKDLSSTF